MRLTKLMRLLNTLKSTILLHLQNKIYNILYKLIHMDVSSANNHCR